MIDRQQLEAALPFIASRASRASRARRTCGPDRALQRKACLGDADWRRYATYLASRPDQAELEAIRLMIRLCRQYGFRLHIVHLSTAFALDELRAARAEGLPVTVETCPHYLHFAAEEIADGATLLKCAPPIRNKENQQQLWSGLRDGIIDMIVTDHSPCPPAMKGEESGRFDLAWGGIASLSVALSVIHTECRQRGFTLDDIVRWMSSTPAALAGLSHRAGTLAAGRDANFIIFDSDAEFTVTPDRLHYRHAISPYLNQTLRGTVIATHLRGEAVYRQGSFAQTSGREVTLW
jgi:allantoinase